MGYTKLRATLETEEINMTIVVCFLVQYAHDYCFLYFIRLFFFFFIVTKPKISRPRNVVKVVVVNINLF